jgi:hypothetical protein
VRIGHRRRVTVLCSAALALCAALAVAPAANGATLYSNLTGGGSDSSGTGEISTTSQRLAEPFVPTASGTPRIVGFYGVSYLGFPAIPATVSISIYTNSTANGGQPNTGELIATSGQAVIDADSDASPTCMTLTDNHLFGENAFLTAGQKYWAVMRIHNANHGFWSTASQGGLAPKMSNDSGGTWAATAYGARSLLVDDGTSCQPDIDTIPKPNPDPNAELGDMYAKPGGTSFQTLSAANKGVADLTLTGGSFSGLSPGTPAGMFKVFNGDPSPDAHPPGTPFVFPKTLGSSGGGVILLYIGCTPPAGTPDGMYTATFTLTSNDPDESPLTWPVWCLIDSTPPSLEFIVNPDGRDGWFVTRPAPIQIRGIDPESGNRVIRIFCNDNDEASLNWPNGPFASFGIQPDGLHALDCQGTDLARNTSALGAYKKTVKVDGTPPQTTKGDTGPPAVSDATSATFTFTGSDATSGVGEFECRLDDAPYEVCTSPASRSGLGNRTHTFDVRARDVAGNYDPTPAQWTWEVNAPAPQAADDAATATGNAPVDIDVLANDVGPGGGTLTIVLGDATTEKGGAVSLAGSKVHYVPPPGFAGTDTFSYQAVTDTGVMSAPAIVTVEVLSSRGSGGKPDVTITSGPSGKTKDKTPTFKFSSTDPTAKFSCSLDDAAPAACRSPFTSKKLKKGKHTFAVFATNSAGNKSAPATRSFKVKKKKKKHR